MLCAASIATQPNSARSLLPALERGGRRWNKRDDAKTKCSYSAPFIDISEGELGGTTCSKIVLSDYKKKCFDATGKTVLPRAHGRTPRARPTHARPSG